MGLVIVAGALSRDLRDASIVVAGMLVWAGWPVAHTRYCARKLARAFEREDARDARRAADVIGKPTPCERQSSSAPIRHSV